MALNDSLKPYFTICLDVYKRHCIVIGGGEVASRRATALVSCGAKLTVVSPELNSVLEYLSFQKEIEWTKKEFTSSLITNDTYLVIAATNNRKTNQEISRICKEKKILCNIVDEPSEGNFIVPSSMERGPLSISISTSGISPSLAASIRQELETVYGEEYGTFLELLATLRPIVQEEIQDSSVRQEIFRRMVASRALELIEMGNVYEAQQELKNIINAAKYDAALKNQ